MMRPRIICSYASKGTHAHTHTQILSTQQTKQNYNNNVHTLTKPSK